MGIPAEPDRAGTCQTGYTHRSMVPHVASPSGSSSVRRSLWIARTTWAVMLVVSLSYLAFPLFWGFVVTHYGWPRWHVEALGPSGLWCTGSGFPWMSYVKAALLVLASTTLPHVLHRRSIARLRRRSVTEIDPSHPGTYRNPPDTTLRLAHPEATRPSAAARYTARLALSFALVAPVLFFAGAHMGWFIPYTSCVVSVQCYVDPAEYGPLILLAAGVIAVQVPTRRRALRSIEDLDATSRSGP